MRVRVHVYEQKAEALLARVAKDLIFNYWLGHLREWTNGTILWAEKPVKAIIGTKRYFSDVR